MIDKGCDWEKRAVLCCGVLADAVGSSVMMCGVESWGWVACRVGDSCDMG